MFKILRKLFFVATILLGTTSLAHGQCDKVTTICAFDQPGADWSQQVNAAFAKLGTTRGTVDARSRYTTRQQMSVSIPIPDYDTLLLPGVEIDPAVGAQFITCNGARMLGMGQDVLTFLRTANDPTPFIVNNCFPGYSNIYEDFQITVSGVGLHLLSPQKFVISRLYVSADVPLELGGPGACACYNSFYDNVFFGTTYGANLSLGGVTRNSFFNGEIRSSANIGIYGGDANVFIGVASESCCTNGTFGITGQGNTIIAPYSEGHAIVLEPGAKYNYIFGYNGLSNISDYSGGFINGVDYSNYLNYYNTWLSNKRILSFGAKVSIPPIKANTGQRYVCIDTDGSLVSSATPCSGT